MAPQLLLLDEPTQGMAREDVQRVTARIRKEAQGRTVLMVEYNMCVVAESSYAKVGQLLLGLAVIFGLLNVINFSDGALDMTGAFAAVHAW